MFQAVISAKQGFAGTKFIIELQFVGKHVLQIAAESQADQQEWLLVFQRAIKASDSLDTQSFSNQSGLNPSFFPFEKNFRKENIQLSIRSFF